MSRPRRRRNDPEGEKFVDHMMYLMTAPSLTAPGQQSIYDHNDNKVTAKLHRLGHSKEILENQECTEFEAMIYISTVTLEHPIGHDWYEVYMYLFKRWSPEKAAAAGIDGPDELNNYPQKEDLSRLRKWIFMRQMQSLKKWDSDEPMTETEEVQMHLFDMEGQDGN